MVIGVEAIPTQTARQDPPPSDFDGIECVRRSAKRCRGDLRGRRNGSLKHLIGIGIQKARNRHVRVFRPRWVRRLPARFDTRHESVFHVPCVELRCDVQLFVEVSLHAVGRKLIPIDQ